MSTSRVFTFFFSSLGATAARRTTTVPRHWLRRGYSSPPRDSRWHGLVKEGDMPWPPKKKHSRRRDDGIDEGQKARARQQWEILKQQLGDDLGGGPPVNRLPIKGFSDPAADKKGEMTGKTVPPPSADNRQLADGWEERRKGHEEYKELVGRQKQTRVASSSSDMPSKRIFSEHPREDPLAGEGEAIKKGGPARDPATEPEAREDNQDPPPEAAAKGEGEEGEGQGEGKKKEEPAKEAVEE
ncbi:hypothetical protein F4778DRAFT_780152 [Xylariomycetidae sp. FL2044]|nr:hypothetical protein F4778DRAFT_780152 [Xylariomycetidae sp. FL2044]